MSYFLQSSLGATTGSTTIDTARISFLEAEIKKVAAAAAKGCPKFPAMQGGSKVCYTVANNKIKDLQAELAKLKEAAAKAKTAETIAKARTAATKKAGEYTARAAEAEQYSAAKQAQMPPEAMVPGMPGAPTGPNYLLYGGIAVGLIALFFVLRSKPGAKAAT